MVEKQTWFMISYLSSFFSVYMMATAYMVLPNLLHMTYPVSNEFITSYNTTMYGMNSLTTMSNWLPTVAILVIAVIVIGFIVASFSMGRAIDS